MMKEQSMTSKSTDCSSQGPPQGENAAVPPQAGPPELQSSRSRNQVFKSGPLFISSKGIGWTSWKKRWFILTRTSLVFFRSDPSSAPQKGGEVNLTLGGIDLNNSASVEVKADKKLLTVFFPDGRDGRAFTLKAETLEDLQEWKTALENALAQAPIATQNAGQNGILNSEQADTANGTADQQKDGPPGKSMVIGRPILLALEDIDGSPSFLEKALRFMEIHGAKIEGILRQAADVDDVYRRVREYEQGKNEFSPDEDAHVISDCIKYILRELPSSPVPASCCNALLEAFRSDRSNRLNAMRTAILETFPEPNRRLLQRILLMMQTVISYKTVNRMSTSAVAACMSPLLLRPLLAGDCELEGTHMDVAGDGSFQLLQAAAAANHAQAIVITLLDEYDKIFGEGSMLNSGLFSDSDESGSGTEEASDDDDLYEEDDDDDDDDDYHEDDDHEDASDEHDETDDDYEHSVTETCSGSGDHEDSDSCDDKHSERSSSFSKSPERAYNHLDSQRLSSVSPRTPEPQHDHQQSVDDNMKRTDNKLTTKVDSIKLHRDIPAETSTISESDSSKPPSPKTGGRHKFLGSSQFKRQRWGRTPAKKNLSMESIDFAIEDEDEIERLEAAKLELQNQIEAEANGNAILQSNLERRKKALHERRLALEKDVSRLQEQLQKERDLRVSLEAGSRIDEKTPFELQKIALAEENFGNLKQRLDEIHAELNHQHEQTALLLQDRNNKAQNSFSQGMLVNNKDNAMKNELQHVERMNKNEGRGSNTTDRVAYDADRKSEYEKGQHKYNEDGADRDSEWRIEPEKGQQNNKLDGVHRDNDRKNESANKKQNQPNDQKNESANKKQNQPNDQKNESANKKQNQPNDQKNESANENQSQPNDTSQGGSSKFGGLPSNVSSTETPIAKPNPSTSKKSSSKGEGSSSTTSALSKLTTRLNFLKERRNQIATELQSIDKGRGSSTQPALSPGKGKVPEPIHTVNNPGKSQSAEGSFPENVENRLSQSSSSSSHSSGKGSSTEVEYRDSNTKTDNKDSSSKTDNKDSSTKTDNKDSNSKTDNKDSNKKTDNRDESNKVDNKDGNKEGSGLKYDAALSQQNQQHLDRRKSEGGQSSSKNSDKGRRQDGQQSTSRTFSR